jgi:zinc transport system substrate-binding protein
MQERFSKGEHFRMSKKLALWAALFLALTGCLLSFEAQGALSRPRLKIMTTIFPLWEFARAVAGERGDVSLLLPPGSDVHTWQPRVSDMKKLGSVDFLLFIGADLEPWLADILRSLSRPGLRTLEVSRGLALLAGNEDHPRPDGHEMDPHIWLDFSLDQILVDRIQRALSEIEPENAAFFEKNAASYIEQLRRLDAQYQDTLSRCLHKTFIFGGHSAFSYLARRYHLEQIAVYGLSPDAAPTPRQIVAVIELAKKHRVKTIFFETSVSDKMARLIAAQVGADTSLLNPGHNLTEGQWRSGVTFLDLMAKNLESLKHGLVCE